MVEKYPKFGRIEQIEPNPAILLGQEIWWTLKEDGSNFGVYRNDKGDIRVRSRNMDVAEFEPSVKAHPVYPKIVAMMEHNEKNYGSSFIVYGEWMPTGTSPTGIVTNRLEPSIKIFDIFDRVNHRYLNWPQTCLLCHPFDIPVVDTLGQCVCGTMEELKAFKEEMMELTKGCEGVVGKCYQKPTEDFREAYLFFKEKHAYPRPVKVFKTEKVVKPCLDITDARACVAKVFDEMPLEEFKQTKLVMPRIAAKVKEECQEQNCMSIHNLKKLYDDFLSSL